MGLGREEAYADSSARLAHEWRVDRSLLDLMTADYTFVNERSPGRRFIRRSADTYGWTGHPHVDSLAMRLLVDRDAVR